MTDFGLDTVIPQLKEDLIPVFVDASRRYTIKVRHDPEVPVDLGNLMRSIIEEEASFLADGYERVIRVRAKNPLNDPDGFDYPTHLDLAPNWGHAGYWENINKLEYLEEALAEALQGFQ